MKLIIPIWALWILGTAYANERKELGPKPIYNLSAKEYNQNAAVCCFIDWGAGGWLSQYQDFPDAIVFDLKKNKNVSIREIVKDRPAVIQMGSITCPSYDLNIKRIREIEKKYKNKVDFYTLYVRENHPSDLHPTHQTFKQKLAFAQKLKKEDKITHDFLVDSVDGSLHQKLGNFGNSIYLVGKDMKVNHWSIFPDSNSLDKGIDELLKVNGIASKAKFIGGTDVHSIISPDFKQHEKIQTISRMKQREGKVSKEKVIAEVSEHFEYLKKNKSDIYSEFTREQWNSLQELSIFQLKHDMSDEKNKAIWNVLFRSLHGDFRDLYKKRFDKWKNNNKLKMSQDIPNYVLQGENLLN